MSNRQYIRCTFREGDARAYTYHNDGEPVQVGDVVRVLDRSGDGWKKVFVIDAEKPTAFETKAILGKHVDEPAPAPEPDTLDVFGADIPDLTSIGEL